MEQIEVDFEVFKQLTLRRATERVTYNEVIRGLLGIKPSAASSIEQGTGHSSTDWVVKGVRFPAGTEFRAEYKGYRLVGSVEGGALAVRGKRFNTPSAAAMSVTDSAVNGWAFWECRFPGQSSWKQLKSLRRA